MRKLLYAVLILLTQGDCVSFAFAYFPPAIRPSQVVAQADLVVVGKIAEGSVERVEVKRLDHNGKVIRDYVSRATLLVTSVERGPMVPMQMTIWFGGEATPVVGGIFHWDRGDEFPPARVNSPERDPAIIRMYEINTGPYLMCDGDLRVDHVWFLSVSNHPPGLKHDAKAWCLGNAQYVVPLKLKDNYLDAPKEELDFPL